MAYFFRKRYVRKIKARRELSLAIAKAYNPDEPRDERGRWTTGGGGDVRQTIAAWKADQPMHSSADHIRAASSNQAALDRVGSAVGKETGTRWVNPGPKTKESLDRKIGSGKAPETITDAVRGGFMVKEPEEAGKVIASLRAQGLNLVDEGWRTTPLGYFDRTALVRFGDGQVGEVQFWHQAMFDAKLNGGHQMYEEARKLPDGDPRKVALIGASRRLYESVALPASWNAVRGKGGS